MKPIKYRLEPVMGNNGNKQWKLIAVTVLGPNAESTSPVGYFTSIKSAKAIVAHFRRKPLYL